MSRTATKPLPRPGSWTSATGHMARAPGRHAVHASCSRPLLRSPARRPRASFVVIQRGYGARQVVLNLSLVINN
jgi:hypothetical protein